MLTCCYNIVEQRVEAHKDLFWIDTSFETSKRSCRIWQFLDSRGLEDRQNPDRRKKYSNKVDSDLQSLSSDEFL